MIHLKRYASRATTVTVLALLGGSALIGVAHADNFVNDISSAGDRTIDVGGSTTISYKVNANGGDGQTGCNASDGTPVTATLSVPAHVSASTSSLTFSSCNTFKDVTFSADQAGSYNINVSSLSDAGVGSYSDQADFVLVVNAPTPTNTAPVVSVTNVADGVIYRKSDVQSPGCLVVDAEQPSASATPVITGGAYNDLGSHTVTCSFTDDGGLSDSDSVTYTVIRDLDTTPPVITKTVTPSAPDGAHGWYTGTVSIDWTVTELESPETLQTTGCQDVTISADQAATNYDCGATSEGGIAVKQTVTIQRDGTNPDVSLVGGPADGGSYYFGSVPAAPTCSASDGTSGLDGVCSVSGYSALVGSHTVTADAKDMAGNTASDSHSYTVNAWTLRGFYAPVDMGGTLNTVKGGSTVPLKFEVFAGSTELTSVDAIDTFKTQKVSCSSGDGMEDAIEILSTGGTSLRYDTTAGQFIQNWKTPTGAGTCYSATVTTDDGSTISALFKLK
jgi:hypothetical protein